MNELARSLLEQCKENPVNTNQGGRKINVMNGDGIDDISGSHNDKRMTSVQLYQLGLILFDTREKFIASSSKQLEESYNITCHAYRDLMETVTCQNLIWNEIYPAFIALVKKHHRDENNIGDDNELCFAIQSLCGLLRHLSPNNSLFLKFSKMDDSRKHNQQEANDNDKAEQIIDKPIQNKLLESCASIYYHCNQNNAARNSLLELLSIWILHGILCTNAASTTPNNTNGTDNGTFLMETFQILSDYDEHLLSDLQQYQQKSIHSDKKLNNDLLLPILPFPKAITAQLSKINMNNNDHESQEQLLNYLLLICKSSSTTEANSNTKNHNTPTTNTKSKMYAGDGNNINGNNNKKKKIRTSEETARITLDRMVDQVHAILPHLGKGYIETALKCYQYDVDRTVSLLLDDVNNLHPRLRALDPSLASSTQHSLRPQLQQQKEEKEARKLQKQRVQIMEKDAEKQALMLEQFMSLDNNNIYGGGEDEYNDDYDDQYDEIGDGKNNNTNGIFDQAGLYDVDFEMLKEYNRTVRNIQQESEFWDADRNTNRIIKVNNIQNGNVTDEGEQEDAEKNFNIKKYRGPDKGKGGRLIGPDGKYLPFPKRGGRKHGSNSNSNNESSRETNKHKNNNKNKKSNQTQIKEQSNTERNKDGPKANNNNSNGNSALTKQQKRRKNDNKAKIGNHNRKGRALKKTGGM